MTVDGFSEWEIGPGFCLAGEVIPLPSLGTATRTANVDVSLPGSPNAKYLVHQAEFVTNERNVAHVLTSWNDSVEGQDYQYDVTWVLKK